jgi:hypothetical protein
VRRAAADLLHASIGTSIGISSRARPADRRNRCHRRHRLSARGQIERSEPRTFPFSALEAMRACVRQHPKGAATGSLSGEATIEPSTVRGRRASLPLCGLNASPLDRTAFCTTLAP